MKKLTISFLCLGMLATSVGSSSAMIATGAAHIVATGAVGILDGLTYSHAFPVSMCASFIGGVALGICHSKKAKRIGMYASSGVGALTAGMPDFEVGVGEVFRDLKYDMLSQALVGWGLTQASFKTGEKAGAFLAKKTKNVFAPAVATPSSTVTATKVAVCSKSKMGEKLFASVKKMATFFGF